MAAAPAVISPTSDAAVSPSRPLESKDNGELPSPASATAEDTLVHVDMTTLAPILVDQQAAWYTISPHHVCILYCVLTP